MKRGEPVLDKKALMRDKRAQGVAAMGLVAREGDRFRVTTPSLRGRRASYEVWRDEAGKVRCTCLEFEEESAQDPRFRCEHILAVKHAVLNKSTQADAGLIAEKDRVPPAQLEPPPAELEPLPPPAVHASTSAVLPWEVAPLDAWAIVGMNHYFVDGGKHLYVAMTRGDRCIKAEGTSAQDVFESLRAQAEELEAREERRNGRGD